MEGLARKGIVPPPEIAVKFTAVTIQERGDVVVMTSTGEAARWIREVCSGPFAQELQMGASVVQRTYPLVVGGVSTEFDPNDEEALRGLEDENGLTRGSIASAAWMKAPEKRWEGQTIAMMRVVFSSAAAANSAI
ncbi:uncharacterized protein BXZ73DRAFT_58723, partial [Epithele typhae]|uniref:uncharacterized protein n=1 Tax=Epithele typhae TaxID=378194 RepID=UPI0020079CC6